MLRHAGRGLPTALLVTVLVFLLIKLVPDDPAAAILGDRASGGSIQALRNQWAWTVPSPRSTRFRAYADDSIVRLRGLRAGHYP